jgi:hypothetical protein
MNAPISAVLLVSALAISQGSWAATIRRVAGPGDPVPGVPAATFESARYPEFDALGNIQFVGRMAGPPITWENNEGFWRERGGQLGLLSRMNGPVPGGKQDERIKWWAAYGQGLALVSLTGPTVDARSDIALLDLRSESPRTIARDGQAVPGTPPGTYFDYVGFGRPGYTESSSILSARLVGPGINIENDMGLWVDNGVGLRHIVQEGDMAPGRLSRFREFTSEGIDILGRAVFLGHVEIIDGSVMRPETGVYAERNGHLEEILRDGTQAPGLPVGIQIKSIHQPRINSIGQVTMHVDLSGPEIDIGDDRAVYADRGNGVELLAREGDSIPGLTHVTWNGSEGHFATRRDALMSVRSESTEEWQLLSTGWERVRPDPQWGDPAPGTLTTFTSIDWSRANAHGQRVYSAELQNDDDNTNNDRGIWADDENGVLQLVIREGDLVETKLGVFEPIDLDNLYLELGGFNDKGEVLFTAHDGVYIATLSPVPEPATVVIALIGGFVLTWIRIRARASHRN